MNNAIEEREEKERIEKKMSRGRGSPFLDFLRPEFMR